MTESVTETATGAEQAGAEGSASRDPLLSVVVTLVDGGPVMRRFLEAMTSQENPPPLEILLPYDDSAADVTSMQAEFPDVQFLPIGTITPERPIDSPAGQHELFDRRRAAGLANATGDLIAILEDRGAPRADWARQVVNVHAQPNAVIGGAIDCAPDVDALRWAIYVCDFTRYMPPFETEIRDWVSDVNVSYKRRVIDATRDLWKERYKEPIVHWALIEQGEQLQLNSQLVVVEKRPTISLGAVLSERFHWGRLFGSIRASETSFAKRMILTLASPLIPPLLFLRHGRAQSKKGRLGRFLGAAPYTALLLIAWTAGEVAGYVTKKG